MIFNQDLIHMLLKYDVYPKKQLLSIIFKKYLIFYSHICSSLE